MKKERKDNRHTSWFAFGHHSMSSFFLGGGGGWGWGEREGEREREREREREINDRNEKSMRERVLVSLCVSRVCCSNMAYTLQARRPVQPVHKPLPSAGRFLPLSAAFLF